MFNYLLSPRINTLARPPSESSYRFPLPPNRCVIQQTNVSVLYYDGHCMKKIVVKDQSSFITICLVALYSPARKTLTIWQQLGVELLVLGRCL
jgi:hypothetical protein